MRQRSPLWWHEKSLHLRIAAGILKIAPALCGKEAIAAALQDATITEVVWFTDNTSQMLRGMSLELMFKGVLVARKEQPGKSHDLVALARSAGISVTQEQRLYLQLLTHSVKWVGRYPVPITEKEWNDDIRVNSDICGSGYMSETAERAESIAGWEAFSGLWKGAENILWTQYDHNRPFS